MKIKFRIPNGSMEIYLEQVLFRGTLRQFRKLLRLMSQDPETWEENRKLIRKNLEGAEIGARAAGKVKWETGFHKILGIMEERNVR
jgi:hypothetical protein